MVLSDEAKELISKEFEILSKPIDSTLRELNFYKWSLRVFFVFILGGSIFGILELQNYIDDRITTRNEEFNSIIYGSIAQSSNDPRLAVEQYYAFLDKLDNTVLRPNEAIRTIYYMHYISALADAYEIDPQGEFEVKNAFSELMNSKWFRKDYSSNIEKWKNNPITLNALGRCQIKFSDSTQNINTAQQYFNLAASIATRKDEIAANNFGMGMLALSKGNNADAKAFFRKAASLNPKNFAITNYTGNLLNDLADETPMWERASRIYGITDLKQRYKKIINDLQVSKKNSNN